MAKITIIATTAWIGTTWGQAWTALLLIVAASLLFIGRAMVEYERECTRKTSSSDVDHPITGGWMQLSETRTGAA